jgi:integrase
VVTVSKSQHRRGVSAKVEEYELSQSALHDIFSILSSFYSFLIQEDFTEVNPLASIRQKSKFFRKSTSQGKIRRLTDRQWDYVIKTAEHLALYDPTRHERTLFIMSTLYAMYLRISELSASDRWTPTMNDFWQDHEGRWWFTTVGKGNKERQVTVSNSMLSALKRWRQYLNLSPLPTPGDNMVLLPKLSGRGPISSITYLREIIQDCFDAASDQLAKDGHSLEAENLIEATVHWLRHTGISEDVKTRPREHVRDDAGHSSSAITDRYIDIHLKERHASGIDKPIKNSHANLTEDN